MKLYIRSNLNSELHDIAIKSANGGSKHELAEKLDKLLRDIPINRYILVIGSKGYNTGYQKISKDTFNWLYNNEDKELDSYWETSDAYIVLPKDFKPGDRIDYEDDQVKVWEIFHSDEEIYSGIEDEDPMKDENWIFCEDLGIYYLTDYKQGKNYIYIKGKVI